LPELNLILLGPPGSGKGTQAERLQEDFRLPYYATGDILRAAVKEGTEVGKQAQEYMDRGDLVPDEVIIGVIAERLQREEASDGFILDGFPRTVPQAEALDSKMKELRREITGAILIDVPEDEVLRRLGGRRTCEKNPSHIYHVEFDPPEKEGVCDGAADRLLRGPRHPQPRGRAAFTGRGRGAHSRDHRDAPARGRDGDMRRFGSCIAA
jgi:adenylate kinase